MTRRGRPAWQPFKPLRRAIGIPVWADAGMRLLLALGLVLLVTVIHYLDRAGLKDANQTDPISFLDVFYFTMISITTTGFGDIAPISDRARFIEAVIVTPIRLAVIYIFVGTAYNFIIKHSWEKWRMARIQERLADHIVVLGFGISGSQAVHELIARGTEPHTIVVLDCEIERLAEAEALGCNVIEGDATRDETLMAVQIAKAQTVLVSAGRDDTSILIILTARHLAPAVPISAVIRAEDNELLAHQAGANNVINPVRFTGLLLAGSAQGTHVAEYLADLASVSGKVQLLERSVTPEEIGRSIDQLTDGARGLRIYRRGLAIGFWEDAAKHLEPGDIVVEIKPTAAAETSG